MKKICLAVVASAIILAACSSQPTQPSSENWIEPVQAVVRAAASPRLGVTGTFALTVRRAERTPYRTHLNSERDYRDQRNLSIAVTPYAAQKLAVRLSAPPEIFLKGKNILVSGTARRVRIDFTVDGKPTGKYYYQTHVLVSDPAQIKVL